MAFDQCADTAVRPMWVVCVYRELNIVLLLLLLLLHVTRQ
jgi:hypothetical protein